MAYEVSIAWSIILSLLHSKFASVTSSLTAGSNDKQNICF